MYLGLLGLLAERFTRIGRRSYLGSMPPDRILKSLLVALGVCATGCYSGLDGSSGSAGPEGADGADDGADGADDDDDDDDDAPVPACDDLGSSPLRRISSAQYAHMVQDLLPDDFAQQALAVNMFPHTVIDDGFSTYATANTVSSSESIAIEDNAEQIAEIFLENIDTYAPQMMSCLSPGFAPDDIESCIDTFIAEFGTRVFRRPLTEGELDIVTGLYDDIAAEDGPELGLAALVQYFLQAPAFLYMAERAGDGEQQYVALDPYELASRLALLLTDSVPDEELLAAAAEGRLSTREEVEEQARRLLDSPSLSRGFVRFHHEWLRGFALDGATRVHPLWTNDAHAAASEELGAFAQWFLDETDGSVSTLLSTTAFSPDDRLAEIYATGGSRPGILTTAAAMSAQAHAETTSLVTRGAFIRSHVLCMDVPAFPGDIDIDGTLGDYSELPTARERLEPLMLDPSCSGCHIGINPLGFPFEVYDWAGAYRSTENGGNDRHHRRDRGRLDRGRVRRRPRAHRRDRPVRRGARLLRAALVPLRHRTRREPRRPLRGRGHTRCVRRGRR